MAIESAIAYLGQHRFAKVDREPFFISYRVPRVEESIIHWQTLHALADSNPVDIVVLGDSSCLMGVRPNVITKETGLSTWNLGTVATLSVDGHADLLDEFIGRHGAPRVVVYHISSTFGSVHHTREDIDTIGLLRRFRMWRGLRRDSVPQMIPSVRHLRKSAQDAIHTAFIGDAERERFLHTPRGAYPSHQQMEQTLLELQGGFVDPEQRDWTKVSDVIPAEFPSTPAIFAGIHRLTELAQAHAFKLVLAFNPLPEVYLSADTHHAMASLYEALLDGISQEAQGPFPLIGDGLRYYPDELCATAAHLNEQGAQENSREIGAWLSRHLLTPSSANAGA